MWKSHAKLDDMAKGDMAKSALVGMLAMVDYASILFKAVTVSPGKPLPRESRATVYRKSLWTLDNQYRRLNPRASEADIARELRQFAQAVKAVEDAFRAAAE